MDTDYRKSIASLALFRKLYDKENDILSILSDFCKFLIVEKKVV